MSILFVINNVSAFIKEHIPLCICTLGLAIPGYLGYHAIRWIINKCLRIWEVDQVAQKNIYQQPSSHSSKSPINRVSNLEISPGKITMGQGEYIVFHKLPTGEKQPLSRETFEQVYKVLLRYSPVALTNSGSEKASEECANRYELLKAKLKEIDPTLETVFVPRTLCELIFIRKCIQEDLKHKSICPQLNPWVHTRSLKSFKNDEREYREFVKTQQEERLKRKCWHLCYFTDMGDNEHVGVKNVAYRLNKAMLKALDPSSEGFTHQELSVFAEKEIDFLKNHHKKSVDAMEKLHRGEIVEAIRDTSYPGPTTNFGYESMGGAVRPMGIRNETDAQIIRNAIALDCSKIAQHSFFLYRGADFQNESTSCRSDKNCPYSLSIGTSLFAGCVHDGEATAFYFMRNQQNAYAIPVPFDQINNSPFFVPTTNTVAQLFGAGEIFHARTKAWKDFDIKEIGGMNMGANGDKRDHLRSNLSKKELNAQFAIYKERAFQLK
jgi:hypothetical protein